MMNRQVLFVQGGGEGAHAVDAALVRSLAAELGPGYEIRYPLMPDEASPASAPWKRQLARELAAMADGSILVGHSVGATILINALAEGTLPSATAGVFLIAAPFVGDGGWQSDDLAPPADIGARLPRALSIYLYQGSDDEIVPFEHIALYAKSIRQAVVRRLDGRNHQLNEDMSEVARDIAGMMDERADEPAPVRAGLRRAR